MTSKLNASLTPTLRQIITMTAAQGTHKAAMYYGAKDIRVEEVPVPQLERGQCKVKIAW